MSIRERQEPKDLFFFAVVVGTKQPTEGTCFRLSLHFLTPLFISSISVVPFPREQTGERGALTLWDLSSLTLDHLPGCFGGGQLS